MLWSGWPQPRGNDRSSLKIFTAWHVTRLYEIQHCLSWISNREENYKTKDCHVTAIELWDVRYRYRSEHITMCMEATVQRQKPTLFSELCPRYTCLQSALHCCKQYCVVQCFSGVRNNTFLSECFRASPACPYKTIVLKWRWIRSIGGMILIGGHQVLVEWYW